MPATPAPNVKFAISETATNWIVIFVVILAAAYAFKSLVCHCDSNTNSSSDDKKMSLGTELAIAGAVAAVGGGAFWMFAKRGRA